jgi:hypothetical protein
VSKERLYTICADKEMLDSEQKKLNSYRRRAREKGAAVNE